MERVIGRIIEILDVPPCNLLLSSALFTGHARSGIVRSATDLLTSNANAISTFDGHVSLNLGLHNLDETLRTMPVTAQGATNYVRILVEQPAPTAGGRFWLEVELRPDDALFLEFLEAAGKGGWLLQNGSVTHASVSFDRRIARLRAAGICIARCSKNVPGPDGKRVRQTKLILGSNVEFSSRRNNTPVVNLREILPLITENPFVWIALGLDCQRRERRFRELRATRMTRRWSPQSTAVTPEVV